MNLFNLKHILNYGHVTWAKYTEDDRSKLIISAFADDTTLWKILAQDSKRKVDAIKCLRSQFKIGDSIVLGLFDAKNAVEYYIDNLPKAKPVNGVTSLGDILREHIAKTSKKEHLIDFGNGKSLLVKTNMDGTKDITFKHVTVYSIDYFDNTDAEVYELIAKVASGGTL